MALSFLEQFRVIANKIRFFLLCLCIGSYVAQAQNPIVNPTVSSEILAEVVDGAGRPLPVEVDDSLFDFFDDYSWRMFVALNWPAVKGQRGIADSSLDLNDTSRPRVWETWKSAFESIPPNGKQPTPWESFDAVVPIVGVPFVGGGASKIFGSFTRFGDISQADFGNLAGPLVCRNNTFAHYEIRVNQKQFDFIVSEKLYDRKVIDGITTPVSFPSGSIEVKAAWREFNDSDSPETRKRYYRVEALAQDYRTNAGVKKEFGLIGLHIVQKTPLRPQWIWSSFEHVDNVPSFGQRPAPGSKFSLNEPALSQNLFPATATDTATSETYLDSNSEPILAVAGARVATPMQVIRKLPIAPQTLSTNQRYQNKLAGTVWANYMIVTTQWPSDPSTPDGTPFPPDPTGNSNDVSISNTTMETYFQNGTSCMTCHHLFGSNKLDFVFFPSVHAQSQDPGPEGSDIAKFMKRMDKEFSKFRENSLKNDAKRLGF
jgi:hypothetical protein